MPDYKHLDFEDIKQRFPIVDVARLLQIELTMEDGLRGKCPYCADHRGFRITPAPKNSKWGLAGCFACHKRGINIIQLVMDFRQFDNPRHAAEYLLEHLGNSTVPAPGNSTVPPPRNITVPDERKSTVSAPQPSQDRASKGFDRKKYQDGLSRQHELLTGIPADLCERADIGVSSRGALKGIVLPIYDKDTGEFLHYIRVEAIHLPTNVVQLKKAG